MAAVESNGVAAQNEKEDVALASTIFARLHPATYLSRFLTNGIRPDGRSFDAFRPATAGQSTIDSAEGSCIVRLGNTVVIAGVKAELLDTSDEQFEDDVLIEQRQQELEDAGQGSSAAAQQFKQAGLRGLGPIDRRRVVVGVDLAPMSSARFRPGPPGEEAQVLASRIMRTLDACPPLSAFSLEVERGQSSWCLYVDVVCIAYDGNPLDAVMLAVNGALQDVRLPFDLDKPQERERLQLHASPLSFTFVIIDNRYLLSDANAFEASMATASITIVLNVAQSSATAHAELVEIHCSGPISALIPSNEVRKNGLDGTPEEGEDGEVLRVQDDQLIKLCLARARKQSSSFTQALQHPR